MMKATRLLPLPLIVLACARPQVATAPRSAGGVPAGSFALTHSIDSMIDAEDFRSANWGVLIVDPVAQRTLYSRNATKLFIPASNEKLVTTSVILSRLGPDYRYRTVFAARGGISNGTLDGDLAVIGRGDPTASNHMQGDAMRPMRGIADSLWQRGIRHVTGRVVAAGDAFPGPVAGSGWPWDGLESSSYAGVDELLFNEGLATLRVHSGANVGDPVVVQSAPARTYPALRVLATTARRDTTPRVAAGRAGRGGAGARLSVHHDTLTSLVVVAGQLALGDSATLTVTQHDPDLAYVTALTEAMRDRGIAVDNLTTTSASSMAAPSGAPHADSLFTVTSVTLREIMPMILKPSQNQIAETFLRTIGLEGTGIGTADSGRRVIERQFADWKIPADGFVVRDGSGLSRNDLISPEAIVDILEVMRKSPNFQVFYDALPIGGVDGTIGSRMKNTPAQGNVHAKTGTLQMARSLSGYVTTADGRMLEFSLLCNNWTVPQATVDRVADAIVVGLAGMRLGR